MSQLVNYSIIEAGLRALADKAHESAVAQAEGKPIPCGLSEGDMELVALLTAMMNDTQANKGWCAHKWASLSHPLKSMFTMARYPKASMTSSGMRRSGISRLFDTLPTRRLSSTSYHESTASTFSNRYTLYI